MRLYRAIPVVFFGGAFSVAMACSSGFQPGELEQGSTDAAVLPSTPEGDASTGPAVVPPPGEGVDSCVGDSPNESAGFFVATAGSKDEAACGTRATPCASIQAAINKALTQGKLFVYVSAGVYTEAVHLAPNIVLQGGWPVNFTKNCDAPVDPALVTIVAPADQSKTIVADKNGSYAIEALTVRSKDAASNTGESLYGIFATGSSTALTLTDVAIEVKAAGAGAPAGDGSPGVQGGSCTTTHDGASGTVVGTNGSAQPGSFSPSGYSPGAGTPGAPGQAGRTGVDGQAECDIRYSSIPGNIATCTGSFNTQLRSWMCRGDGAESVLCANAGSPGCGGSAGAGGGGGGGGGSSIALFAWDAQVVVKQGSLTSGHGGNGGKGGGGGAAASGVGAAPGNDSSIDTCQGPPPDGSGGCQFRPKLLHVLSPAGAGGASTRGGSGAGGSGGSSFAYYQGGAAIVRINGTSLKLGLPGKGGPGGPGAPVGLDGKAANGN